MSSLHYIKDIKPCVRLAWVWEFEGLVFRLEQSSFRVCEVFGYCPHSVTVGI